MTAKEARALNLAYLVRLKAANSQRVFADTFGFSASHISQMINYKTMGNRKAREIEELFNLPKGAMDRPLEGADTQLPQVLGPSVLGPLYDELGIYWPKLHFKMQVALLEMARTAMEIDRRKGADEDSYHRRRSGDEPTKETRQ